MSFRRPSSSVEECSKAEKNGGGEAAVLPHIRLKRSEFSPANLNVEYQIPIHQYFRNIPGKSVKKKRRKRKLCTTFMIALQSFSFQCLISCESLNHCKSFSSR